jgi:DUF1009 family protein
MSDAIGLIAGNGRLPFIVAQGARKAGLHVICAALADNTDPALRDCVDEWQQVPLARPGAWIRALRRHNVRTAVMVGWVAKNKIYTPRRILHYLPDWRAARIWYIRMRGKDRRNDTLLCALADELASGGIILENSTMYCKEHLATSGLMTAAKPGMFVNDDIEFGWAIVKKLGELDIGQALAVKEKEIIAIEAIEGTAEMIERAGKFCKSGGWTLIKAAKPGQDMRFDVPCVGVDTIESLARNGAKCLVVEAGKTIIIDKDATIAMADKLGIAVIGHESC